MIDTKVERNSSSSIISDSLVSTNNLEDGKDTIKGRTTRRKYAVSVTDDNCLSRCYPEIAEQWHPTRNGGLTADDVGYGSHKRVWWVCPTCGNVYSVKVQSRVNSKFHNHCGECYPVDSILLQPAYWRPWQDLCEVIAQLIFPEKRMIRQRQIGRLRPDIAVEDCSSNIERLIDAKMTCERHHILPSVEFYSDHCEILEFWSFWDLPVDALKSVELENGVSLILFSSQELLLRINDLQARLIIARRLQILREKVFNHKYFGKKPPSLL